MRAWTSLLVLLKYLKRLFSISSWALPKFSSGTSSPQRAESSENKSRTCDNGHVLHLVNSLQWKRAANVALGMAMVCLLVLHFDLNNCWIDFHEIPFRHSCSTEDESYWLNDPPTFSLAPPACQMLYLSSEISQHLLDGLAQATVHTFMPPKGWTVITLATPVLFLGLWPNTCKTNDIPISLTCTCVFIAN